MATQRIPLRTWGDGSSICLCTYSMLAVLRPHSLPANSPLHRTTQQRGPAEQASEVKSNYRALCDQNCYVVPIAYSCLHAHGACTCLCYATRCPSLVAFIRWLWSGTACVDHPNRFPNAMVATTMQCFARTYMLSLKGGPTRLFQPHKTRLARCCVATPILISAFNTQIYAF